MPALADIRAKYPQYGDLSDEDFAQKFHQKFYSDMPFETFAQKVGYQQPEMGLGRQLLGNAEIAGSTIANIPSAVIHAGRDLLNRVTGSTPTGPGFEERDFPHGIHVPTGQAGQELSNALGKSLTGTIEGAGLDKPATAAAGATNEYLTGEPTSGTQAVVQATAPAIGDIATLAGAKSGLAPIREGLSAVREGAAAATGEGTPWKAVGFRNGGGHPIARNVAGESGQEALTLHNQAVGNTIGASEAGLPQGAQLNYDSLADARVEPSSVYNRAANALPTQELDAQTKGAIGSAANLERTATLTDADQARVQGMAQRAMNGPRTGQQVIEDIRTLRQEGFKRSASEDVDQQNIGKAQLGIARALEGYVGKALPKNADVSLDQFQAARKALAKNWTVQEALHGSDIDMQALARVARADPELLDGGLKTTADFANDEGREVTGLAQRYNPPGVVRDLAGVVNIHRPVQSTLQGIPGVGSTARRFLTGDTAAAIDRARAAFPNRVSGQFGPLPRFNTSVPPWMQAETPPPVAPQPGGANRDFADVLSQGLEQRPPQPITAGPMGAPQGEGLPFRGSPEAVGAQPVHGGAPPLAPRFTDDYGNEINPNQEPAPEIPLGDRFARGAQPENRPPNVIAERPTAPAPNAEPSLGDLVGQLGDYAKVLSQGVPEGIAMRAGPRTGPSRPWLVDEGRPGNDRGVQNLMDDIFGAEPTRAPQKGVSPAERGAAEEGDWFNSRRPLGGPGAAPNAVEPMEAPSIAKASADNSAPSGKPNTAQYQRFSSGGGLASITNKAGKRVGTIEVAPGRADNEAQVTSSAVDRKYQGKGYGLQMYEKLVQELHSEGKTLVSDSRVSEPAQRVYDALKRRGYDVRQNPSEPFGTGELVNQTGGPVYEVHPPKLGDNF